MWVEYLGQNTSVPEISKKTQNISLNAHQRGT